MARPAMSFSVSDICAWNDVCVELVRQGMSGSSVVSDAVMEDVWIFGSDHVT